MDHSRRIPLSPPAISPVSTTGEDTGRPRWSVMIPVYNCVAYLPGLLESILYQDPGTSHMQIEVCDDASTDADIEQLVLQAGKGRVSYFRQPYNVGSLRNFETCLNRSRGQLIHLLHGDDKIRTGFYEKMGTLFLQFPEAGAAFCRYVSVDEYSGEEIVSDLEKPEPGILDHWLERLACKQLIQAPAMVVRREVYENLGGFYGVHYGEDWEMWLRIAAHYPTGYVPEILAEYRKHADSISGRYILTGQNIRDLKRVMRIAEEYFTPGEWRKIHQQTKKTYALYAINTARKLWGRYRHKSGARKQVREAFGLAVNRDIIFRAAKLYVKMLLGIKR